ncbi:MAG: hypothetical protein IJR02_00185 [Bacteroidaceae bacterium]|nr:hypothetical protein [Bacteroidaceae bacterium]MBQ7460727.1 hypothetical protein [Bacteroidaceae bacterium]
MKKHLLYALMALLPAQYVAATPQPTADNDDELGYTLVKISNPDRGEREVDGLMPGGDRENSYTWRLAMRGDEIYIATTRNIASALVNLYAPQFAASGITLDTFWAMINAVTNGDIPRNDANEGANIISYNRKTGEFKVIYTADTGDYFRMAVTFGENVYFGSYSANPANAQYILKLDPEGNFTKVFQTMGSVSLRANCEYDGHLFFAGADDREEVREGDMEPMAKMAVLRKSNEDDTVWERVADYKDFGWVAYDPIQGNWAGAPIWELANHNGYIYATAPSHAGFVIYKGHPAAEGETANEYGWYWEEVAGLTNGINNPGLSDVPLGEPGTMRSLIGSVYEFKGELYAYNFDHSFGGEASAFAGILQQVAGKDVKASDYLFYMYNSLQNPQKVWKLNDETGKFEELTNFTKLTEGTLNEYIWRMGTYDDQLYISTMDAGIFYNYITQLTNKSFFQMSLAERITKVKYIAAVLNILIAATVSEKAEDLKSKLETLKSFLEAFTEEEQVDEETVKKYIDYQKLAMAVSAIVTLEIEAIKAKIAAMPGEDIESKVLLAALEKVQQAAEDIAGKIDLKGAEMYLYINHMVMTNEWGFDLFRTYDGENFEVITRTGFGDKYNYGCPSFLATEEGLYIGTCNPFYGGQLYLLTNKPSDRSDIQKGGNDDGTTGINEIAADENAVYYDLQGRSIKGRPATKGIYILNGKKVVNR